MRGEIERRLADFSRFAERLDTGIKPVATEVTYINVIGGEVRVQLDQVLNFVSRPPVASLGPDAIIDTNIQIRFDTTTETGRTSNLTLSAGRDNSRDPAPIVLQLSSHAEVGDAPVTDALDLSHRLVVTSFRDLTTSTMHSEWGLV